MKRFTAILVAFAASVSASIAAPYAGINLNWYKVTDAADGSFAPELVFGGSFAKMLRAEGAFTYQKDDIGTVDLKTSTIFGNLYVDFASEDKKMTPYLLGGLGLASVKGEETLTGASSSDSELIAQLGGGIGLKVGENGTVDFKYRYQFGQEYNMLGASFRMSAHVLGVGYRYSF